MEIGKAVAATYKSGFCPAILRKLEISNCFDIGIKIAPIICNIASIVIKQTVCS